ncbi:MAG TPA: HAMP domain-containing sensor histidine kinase [Nitrososphaeraceae archaeon]|nr:HAMP domain-containing sensor histidine kinase [Nitrososphaeraceae archaeon]
MSSPYKEKSQVITNRKQSDIITDVISNAEKNLNICGDSALPDFTLTGRIRKALQQAKLKGIKIRYITEITKDNLSSCKQLMNFAEVRHLDKIIGNFLASDKEYFGQSSGNNFLSNQVYNDDHGMVEQQNYIFEILWNNAIIQHDKISSIEVGVDLGEVKVISDPYEIRRTYVNLIKSANSEISLIIATPRALQRNYRGGIISMLIEASEKKNVNVNLVIPKYENDKTQDDFLHTKSLAKNFRFRIKSIVPVTTQTHKIKTTFLIVDKKWVLIIDVKDDNKDNFVEAVGYATFHTSKSRAESYNFIFDTIWRQADLYESLREANNNLLYSYQKLEEHDAMEKEFINLAAHELRTPSQSIVGYSEMLKDLPERNKQYEEAILRNAERLYSLVTNMLNIARIESQTMDLNKTIFDLNIKIDDVIKDISQQLELRIANKVAIEFKPIGIINITADKEKIFQVFTNLLNNALKFTNQGAIIITAKQKVKTNQAVVMIKDSGPGIDPEIIPHLFTKFKAKSEKGLGLGLYISKNIIEAHHGKIEAYNNPNSKGATFVVTLPLKG